MIKRIRHYHIARAVKALNERRGLSYGDKGYLQYADIRGDGGPYRPGFYSQLESGGVVNVSDLYRGETMLATFTKIQMMR